MESGGSSFFLNFATGVFKEVFDGIHSGDA